jgi:hypothetical protein
MTAHCVHSPPGCPVCKFFSLFRTWCFIEFWWVEIVGSKNFGSRSGPNVLNCLGPGLGSNLLNLLGPDL